MCHLSCHASFLSLCRITVVNVIFVWFVECLRIWLVHSSIPPLPLLIWVPLVSCCCASIHVYTVHGFTLPRLLLQEPTDWRWKSNQHKRDCDDAWVVIAFRTSGVHDWQIVHTASSRYSPRMWLIRDSHEFWSDVWHCSWVASGWFGPEQTWLDRSIPGDWTNSIIVMVTTAKDCRILPRRWTYRIKSVFCLHHKYHTIFWSVTICVFSECAEIN